MWIKILAVIVLLVALFRIADVSGITRKIIKKFNEK